MNSMNLTEIGFQFSDMSTKSNISEPFKLWRQLRWSPQKPKITIKPLESFSVHSCPWSWVKLEEDYEIILDWIVDTCTHYLRLRYVRPLSTSWANDDGRQCRYCSCHSYGPYGLSRLSSLGTSDQLNLSTPDFTTSLSIFFVGRKFSVKREFYAFARYVIKA